MKKQEIATFGAGCFWGIELTFSKMSGVISTKVGYMGGDIKYKAPTYEQVCSDKTGHVEVVQITFDPAKLNYKELLRVFWSIHDPTTLNRQGPDVGTQYRSIIFYHNEKQKSLAIKSKQDAQKNLGNKKIVTEIKKASTFNPAEEYHQKYLEKRGLASCKI